MFKCAIMILCVLAVLWCSLGIGFGLPLAGIRLGCYIFLAVGGVLFLSWGLSLGEEDERRK